MALTQQDRDLLRRLYRNTDPNKPLEPGGALSGFYQPIYEGPGVEDPVALLQAHIDFQEVQGMSLLSGFRGSGKTTELLRLKKRLEDAGHLVLYADALEYVHPAQTLDIGDLLFAVSAALGEAVHQAGFGDMAAEGYFERMWAFLHTEIEFKELSYAGIKATLRDNDSFRTRLREKVAAQVSKLKGEVDQFAEECAARIRKKRPTGKIVFLFDQLEQIRGSLSTEREVIASVERLFLHHLRLLALPRTHVVYTIPPWLKFVLPGTQVHVLHSIRQWDNDPQRTAYAPGSQQLAAAVSRRFGQDGMERFWRSTAQLDRIVGCCGGHFKDLLRLLQEVITRAAASETLPAEDGHVETAIVQVRGSMLPIADDDAMWLHRVATSRTCALPSSGEEAVSHLTRLIDAHLILYLRNGEEWYDVHPLVRRDVEATAARVAAKANVS